MKKKRFSVFHIVLLVFFSLFFLSALGYCIYYFQLGAEYYDGQAREIAQSYVKQLEKTADDNVNKAFSDVVGLAADVSSATGEEALEELCREKAEQLNLVCLRFYHEGTAEYEGGKEIAYSGTQWLWDAFRSGKPDISGVFTDKITSMKYVGFFCPVNGSEYADGVIAYYSLDYLLGEKALLHEKAYMGCLSLTDGVILEALTAKDVQPVEQTDIYEYLLRTTENKSEAEDVKKLAENREECLVTLHVDGRKFVAAGFPEECLGEEYYVLQLFSQDVLLQDERVLAKGIFAISVIIVMLSVIALVVCVLFIRSSKKKMFDETEFDPVLVCNTYDRFAYEAKELLEQNRFSRYAVINFDIYKFHYLNERMGADEVEKTLKYISDVCKQMTDANETFGHVMNDSFVLLMHYTEVRDLAERIKLLGALVASYSVTNHEGIDLRLSVGICLVTEERHDIQKIFSCAKMALQTNKQRIDAPYTIYDSSIASAYLEEAELEVKMNSALKSKDFKLFFQPKYSVEEDRVESAEVLVRWYNPETQSYIAPDKFIRLFEANGFVSELDHYVFEETCRFLNHLTTHGDKIVPLAVNVSRATAIKPDFLNFYVEKKKEYGVEDGFITLEVTETFASESCELLGQLLPVLKSNGFKCAIDDFGMGNSSLIAVKELPVDELKFDRALIKHSGDDAKDDALLKMLIDVSKSIGMRVTQEGVETREDMERLRALGCDTIQGYYYAKPMQTVDFIEFLQNDTSIVGVRGYKRSE